MHVCAQRHPKNRHKFWGSMVFLVGTHAVGPSPSPHRGSCLHERPLGPARLPATARIDPPAPLAVRSCRPAVTSRSALHSACLPLTTGMHPGDHFGNVSVFFPSVNRDWRKYSRWTIFFLFPSDPLWRFCLPGFLPMQTLRRNARGGGCDGATLSRTTGGLRPTFTRVPDGELISRRPPPAAAPLRVDLEPTMRKLKKTDLPQYVERLEQKLAEV